MFINKSICITWIPYWYFITYLNFTRKKTQTKSINFCFFMSTSRDMKPIVLFSSSLSKHNFSFRYFFGWYNTNKFIPIKIIKNQFFWPNTKFKNFQELKKAFYYKPFEHLRKFLYILRFQIIKTIWYYTWTTNLITYIFQKMTRDSLNKTSFFNSSISNLVLHRLEMYTIEPYHTVGQHLVACNSKQINEEPKSIDK